MSIEGDLLELEQQGWHALSAGRGAEFYDAFMTDDAVMLLPVGVLARDQVVEALHGSDPWASFEIENARVLRLNEDCVAVTYTATAQRAGKPEYRALMTTTYVRQDDEWLIAIHQQTPLVEAPEE